MARFPDGSTLFGMGRREMPRDACRCPECGQTADMMTCWRNAARSTWVWEGVCPDDHGFRYEIEDGDRWPTHRAWEAFDG